MRTIGIATAICMAMSLVALPAQAQRVSAAARQQVQRDGEVRVFVMLRDQTVERGQAANGVARKTDVAPKLHPRVRADVDTVLSALPARARGNVLRRFERVPAFVLRADAATLAALNRNPRVMRVDLDVGGSGHAVAPDESSVLNQVHQLAALGVGGAGMKVGIVDTGIDTDHIDLRARIVGQQCFCTVGTGCCPNGGNSQSGAGAAEDDHGHGTNVAGIIGGDGTVAPQGALPAVSLVSVKVIDRNNRFNSTSDVIAALDWLAGQHPDIDAVNLSLGTDALFAGDCDNTAAWTQALAVAVANLNALGAVVTASSGNQGNLAGMSAPACIRNVVSNAATWDVSGGATTFLGCTESATAPRQPTCFSNRSVSTDLFAAGAFVRATGFNGATSTFGGTSQAAPMAAACAVALKQAAPASTVTQRMTAMTLSPTRIQDTATGRSYPFLDCRDALKLLNPAMFDPIPVNGARPRIRPRN
ncbi:MAG: S8 family serine peptidase [Lysobacteraceae bacterium]